MKRALKIFLMIIAVGLIAAGLFGGPYYSFQKELAEKLSTQDLSGAKSAVESWEKSKTYWLLKNIPVIKQNLAFEKGWIAAQIGDYEEAVKEFKKANEHPSLKLKSIYNTATLSLLKGREDWGKVAGEYEKALAIDSDDFQTQVNLEMLKRAQEQQKQEASGQEQSKSGQEQKRIKQFQMKDKGKEGTESPPKDKNPRY